MLTGASGFLGSHLLERLLKDDCYDIAILKRSTSDCWRIKELMDRARVFDIDHVSLDTVFEECSPDYILHLATLYRKFDDGSGAKEMIESNVSFPVELLEIGIRSGLKGFINTGTFFEYDCSIQPINEHAAPAPFNLYAKTKLAFESILKSYSDQLAINTFKLFSPYGEKDNIKLIPMVIQKALNHEKVQLSDGMQKLDFTYVGDIVEAYVKAIDRMVLNDGLTGYSVFNLGSGVPVSIREVVSVIQQNVGEVINVDWGEPSAVDIPIAYADISKIKTELSWSPQYSIHAGIANTIEYYRTRMKNGV